MDGPRGERDGTLARAEARRRQRARRWIVGTAAAILVVAGVAFVVASPFRTLRGQEQERTEADARLAEIRSERARIDAQTKLLATPAEIERQARLNFGFVRPGEVAYNVIPAAVDPVGLPETWPFTGVERALGAG